MINTCLQCWGSPEAEQHIGMQVPEDCERFAELLSACEITLAWLKGIRAEPGDPLREIQDRIHGPYRERLRVAIAKAKGESK